MLDKAKARAIINRIQELDEVRGQDGLQFKSDPGNYRDVEVDERVKAELLKRILPRGAPNVPRSREHVGRVLRRMSTHPRLMVQLPEDGEVVQAERWTCSRFQRANKLDQANRQLTLMMEPGSP
jgi:hypothetical protein